MVHLWHLPGVSEKNHEKQLRSENQYLDCVYRNGPLPATLFSSLIMQSRQQ